jgi:hypothetical protein
MRGTRHENARHFDDSLNRSSSDLESGEEDALLEPSQVDDGVRSLAVVTSRDGVADAGSGGAARPGLLSPNGNGNGENAAPKPQKVVAWRDLPKKKQLVVITMTRLSEPLVQTSLQSYMFYQLKWFDPSLPDAVISRQAGMLHASFTAAQFLTAMLWGRVADSRWAGRKTVLLIGLFGTMVSCLGFGCSTSFYHALFFRSLGGITNGNVGVLRTMISEIVIEKKYQSRAFLLLPMTFNIGIIVGPILGGILSDPAGSYPDLFGNITFFQKFPYALPNIVSAGFLSLALIGVSLFLEEVCCIFLTVPFD